MAAAATAALVAALPFVRGVLLGRSFYFRDLSLYFFPLRRFVAEGLAQGEIRFFNPYVHEGIPLALPPVSYPPDLLQGFFPTDAAFSVLLALHIPFAAVAFFLLARTLGTSRVAAVGGALVYALGGFALSTLNLYVYVQALAWAPLAMWGLVRSTDGGWRRVAVAAVLVGVALSTMGVEVALQALLIGGLLAVDRARSLPATGRPIAAIALGGGLAAAPGAVLAAALASSARAAGFPSEVTLAHAVHPMTLAQMLVGGLYGDLHRVADRFWGQNFFPLGFPYILSLYLGAAVLSVAAVGAVHDGRLRLRLLGLLAVALLVCLGPWAGLGPVTEAVTWLRHFRYPSKAFFTVHTTVALLAALGLDRLGRGAHTAWRTLAAVSAILGALLVSLLAVPWALPGAFHFFLTRFFPPDAPMAMRFDALHFILQDAAQGGYVAWVVTLLAALVARGRFRPPFAAVGLVALLGADLLREGAGLNPMVASDFLAPSPETGAWAESVRGSGRVFTCDLAQSPVYRELRLARPGAHEAWSFAVLADTLTPQFNMRAAVPSALSLDLTMLVPLARVTSPEEANCRDLDRLLPRLRAAGVAHVLSLDALAHDDLAPTTVIAPSRIAPALIHVYGLRGAEPLAGIDGGDVVRVRQDPDALEAEVRTSVAGTLRLDVPWYPGWHALIEEGAVSVVPSSDGRVLVEVPRGEHRVRLRYRPPGLILGLVASGLALMIVGGLAVTGRGRAEADVGAP